MSRSLLVRLLGFRALLIHGDTLVLDRWLWLKRRLPHTRNGERLLDVGSGNGAFTIGAARRGYEALGLTWDSKEAALAAERAAICHAPTATFAIQDVRQLAERRELAESFDVAICFENIEHVLDDRRLMQDIAACLKPGAHLLLTTPNYHYRAIGDDDGPFSEVEDGRHVRRGYTRGRLIELCELAGLRCEEITFCSGWASQKITWLMRTVSRLSPLLGWVVVLPLRWIPPLLDPLLTPLLRWPQFSICLQAYKPMMPGHEPAPGG